MRLTLSFSFSFEMVNAEKEEERERERGQKATLPTDYCCKIHTSWLLVI